MAPTATTCPNCNADLPIGTSAEPVSCKFCGRMVVSQQPPTAPTSPETSEAVAIRPIFFIVPIVLIVGVLMLIGYCSIKKVDPPPRRASITITTPGPSITINKRPEGGRVRVRFSERHPTLVDIDGDGVEDLVTTVWRYQPDGIFLYLQAQNGTSWQQIWQVGGFGEVSRDNANLLTRFVVSGDRVAVADYQSRLHVYQLADGKPTRELSLSDRVVRGCGDPDRPGRVWLELTDEKHVAVDLGSGELESAARPRWCPDPRAGPDCYHHDYHRKHGLAGCRAKDTIPQREGFRADYVLVERDRVVAIGHKHPGTHLPMIAGYSTEANKPPTGRRKKRDESKFVWVRNLDDRGDAEETTPTLADLVGGKLFIQYQTKGELRFAAIDAALGGTIWDVEAPKRNHVAQTMAFTATRLFVPTYGQILVLDRETGETIAYLDEM